MFRACAWTVVLLSASGAAAVDHAADGPVAIVQSFHEALSSGDREKALALLDPDVVIFEQGGAEMSRDEYASQHLPDDIEFFRATSSKVVSQRSGGSAEEAWVLTRSETSGTFQTKPVASRNVETMILAHTASGWRITHIHWSSRSKERPKQ